jgi:hypothetical protein
MGSLSGWPSAALMLLVLPRGSQGAATHCGAPGVPAGGRLTAPARPLYSPGEQVQPVPGLLPRRATPAAPRWPWWARPPAAARAAPGPARRPTAVSPLPRPAAPPQCRTWPAAGPPGSPGSCGATARRWPWTGRRPAAATPAPGRGRQGPGRGPGAGGPGGPWPWRRGPRWAGSRWSQLPAHTPSPSTSCRWGRRRHALRWMQSLDI